VFVIKSREKQKEDTKQTNNNKSKMPEATEKRGGKKPTKDSKTKTKQGREFLVVDRSLRPDTWHTDN
jgi:hypothetical protein